MVSTFYFYRPQRSCGKVMFSQACVKNSVHRGVCLSACWDTHPPWSDPGGSVYPGRVCVSQHQYTLRWTPPQADTPLARHPPGRHPSGQTPLLGRHPRAATAADGTHPTGMHSCSLSFPQLWD